MQHTPVPGDRAPGPWPEVPLATAHVCSGGVHTTYSIAGRGPSVLVLDDRLTASAAEWARLLAGRMRVLKPEARVETVPLGQWLTGFLDGLGVTSMSVIAAGGFVSLVIDLARSGSGSLDRLVLLGAGRVGDISEVGLPVLVADDWNEGTENANQARTLVDFLLEPNDQ